MTDVSRISFVRQDVETYTSLKRLFVGVAKQLTPEFVGDIKLKFPACDLHDECAIRFDWVSSVLYCDEMLWSLDSYPYFKDIDRKSRVSGLLCVEGSSYLARIEPFFPNHHHYIYFDREFNWHITARGIEKITIP